MRLYTNSGQSRDGNGVFMSVNKIPNPDFSRGDKSPQGWTWEAKRCGAKWKRDQTARSDGHLGVTIIRIPSPDQNIIDRDSLTRGVCYRFVGFDLVIEERAVSII